MTQTIKYSPVARQFYNPLPDDCVDLTPDAAQQVHSALNQGLPFFIKADGTVSVAPGTRHEYYADKDRWIDYAYQL